MAQELEPKLSSSFMAEIINYLHTSGNTKHGQIYSEYYWQLKKVDTG